MRSVPSGADAGARVPPHDLDAERAVIGAMLVSEAAVSVVGERLAAEDFYSETHRVLYGAMMRLYSRGEPIDQLTLSDELRSVGEFDRVGGRQYVFRLVESVPTAANAARYAEIVRGKALLRAVIDAGSRIQQEAFSEPDDVTQALDAAEQLIYGVSNRQLKEHLAPVSELAPSALEMIQRLYEAEGEVTGVETGFDDLDRLTTGFHKSDLVILAARPAMGKCLAADSEIVLDDGSVATIEEAFRARRGRLLLTLGDDLKLGWTRPSLYVDDGVKPVFRVTTRLGRTIKTTLTHPFLTVQGWRKLGELSVGDHIAVPRRMPVFGDQPLGDHRVKLLAYMLGDGNMTGGMPRFTNASAVVRDDFERSVRAFGGLSTREEDSGGTRTVSVCVSADQAATRRHRLAFARALRRAIGESPRSARRIARQARVSSSSLTNWCQGKTVPDDATCERLCEALAEDGVALNVADLKRARKNTPNALRRWLDELGLWGCSARDKFVPAAVFRASRQELALFLDRLFATDGWASVLSTGQVQLGYATVSERLARQVQHLLLRFGVVASLKRRSVGYKATLRTAYQLDITDARSIRAFVEQIGIFGKEAALMRVVLASDRRYHANRDLIPREAWRLIEETRGEESWGSLARRLGHGPGHNLHVGTRALSRDRMARFAEVLDDGRLQDLAESDLYWDRIVDIEPLGPQQVYDLTIPETHNFVANDICVHNTAMALNAIWHAARAKGLPVAIFSLEMSKEQLVQRLISQTTRIRTQDLRSGNVKAEDWPKLVRGVAEVSRAPIWIDDTAGITLMEIRAKVRRLASRLNAQGESPLSLVVVDYLQLMVGGGNRFDNRQQEIAEISRGLKVLARDLNIPVLAIAQLSRAVEQRHDKRPLLSDLRDSGCLTGDTQVFLPDEGVYERLDRLIGRTGFRVLALNPDTWKLEPRTVTNSFPTGRKPVFELVTRLGRRVRATANHKFLTVAGWNRLDELVPGMRLALPRRLPGGAAQTVRDEELALLGHLIGDGCTLPRQPIHYTTNDPLLAETVADLAGQVFGEAITPRISRERTWYQVYLPASRRLTHGKRNPISSWLDQLGVFGLRSYEKRVPEEVFAQPEHAIALFLRHLWATDGCIHLGRENRRHPTVYYASSSASLARNIQSLLLRLGINARLRRVSQACKGRDQFHVSVSGRPDIECFLRQIGGLGQYKAPHQSAILDRLGGRISNANRDVLPRELWRSVVVPAMQAAAISARQMQAAIGQTYCGTSLYTCNLSRARAARVAKAVDSPMLTRLAESDVYWDEVVSIEPAGEEEVYDLTVEGLHNFVADDIIVHNSIEQDADMVMFLYRDEYYNPDSDDKGIAEVIVGKHRNGPTGKVQLAWLEQYTKFASLARR